MKYRANLFKKSIVKELDSESIALVEKIHHSLVEISDTEFSIEFIDGEKHKYPIHFAEKDISTSTHLGQFKNGNKFRLIQPIGVMLEMAKINQNSEGGFTIGSIDSSGWAIHFFLTVPDDIRHSEITDCGKSEHVENLIHGVVTAFYEGMQEKFIEIAKRLLPLIESNPMQIYNYDEGDDLAYKLAANASLFGKEEQAIINKIELR